MALEGLALVLRCTANPAVGTLSVAYWLTNQSGGEIGVFNKIVVPRLDGSRAFPPDAVYIDLQDSKLMLQKMVLPAPPNLRMTARILPQASRLPNGQVLHESFDLRLPVQVCQPFRRALLAAQPGRTEIVAAKPAEATEIVLDLGVFPCGDGLNLHPISSAHPDVFDAIPPFLAMERQVTITQVARLNAPIPVLDYVAVPLPAP